MMTNTSATIYNKYFDPSTRAEKYQHSVISAVAWENSKASNTLAMGGAVAANQASIFIPFPQVPNYMSPKAWQALSTKTGYLTFQVGDFIVKGTVTHEITSTPTVYGIHDLQKEHDDVLQITSVDAMDFSLSSLNHFQLGAQ